MAVDWCSRIAWTNGWTGGWVSGNPGSFGRGILWKGAGNANLFYGYAQETLNGPGCPSPQRWFIVCESKMFGVHWSQLIIHLQTNGKQISLATLATFLFSKRQYLWDLQQYIPCWSDHKYACVCTAYYTKITYARALTQHILPKFLPLFIMNAKQVCHPESKSVRHCKPIA